MGNTGLKIKNETTNILVVSFGHVSPLFWQVLRPGETMSRNCGKVWFTVWVEVYNGKNEPTYWNNVLKIGAVSVGTITAAATLGSSAIIEYAGVLVYAGLYLESGALVTAGVTLCVGGTTIIVSSPLILEAFRVSQAPVSRSGVYANGKTLRVTGGPAQNIDPNNQRASDFKAMSIEY
jgi:hypothetical protein